MREGDIVKFFEDESATKSFGTHIEEQETIQKIQKKTKEANLKTVRNNDIDCPILSPSLKYKPHGFFRAMNIKQQHLL